MLTYFLNFPACLVGMDACASAHDWYRALRKRGHHVRFIPPQHVKHYVRGQKHDDNDAAAIAVAVTRPDRHFVPIKTVAAARYSGLQRLRRKGRIQERTALWNQLGGLLSEYGLVLPKDVKALRSRLPEA